MKVVQPIEFIWCGILYVPGQSQAYLRSEPFVGELIGKLNTFSQVCDENSSFTLDIVWQGMSLKVHDETYDGMRVRTSCKYRHELENDEALLKPDADSFGPRFVQVIVGDIDFLLAASRELHAEDGWPSTLSDDIEDAIDLVTREKNILCFLRPQMYEPFLISATALPTDRDTYKQYMQ